MIDKAYSAVSSLVDSYVRQYEIYIMSHEGNASDVSIDKCLAENYNPNNPFNEEIFGIGASQGSEKIDGEKTTGEKTTGKKTTGENISERDEHQIEERLRAKREEARRGTRERSCTAATNSLKKKELGLDGTKIAQMNAEHIRCPKQTTNTQSSNNLSHSVEGETRNAGRWPVGTGEQPGIVRRFFRYIFSSTRSYSPVAEMTNDASLNECGEEAQQTEVPLRTADNRISACSLPPPYTAEDEMRSRNIVSSNNAIQGNRRQETSSTTTNTDTNSANTEGNTTHANEVSTGPNENSAHSTANGTRSRRGWASAVRTQSVNEALFREHDIYGRIDDYFRTEVEDICECEVDVSSTRIITDEHSIYADVQHAVATSSRLPSYASSEAQNMILRLSIMEKTYLAFYEDPSTLPLKGVNYHDALLVAGLLDLVVLKRIDVVRQYSTDSGKESARYRKIDHLRVPGACSRENTRKRKGKGKLFSFKSSEKSSNCPIIRILSNKQTGTKIIDKLLNALVAVQADNCTLRDLIGKMRDLPLERATRRHLWKRGLQGCGPIVSDGLELEVSELAAQVHNAIMATVVDSIFLSSTLTTAIDNLPFNPQVHPYIMSELGQGAPIRGGKIALPILDLLGTIYNQNPENSEKEQRRFLISQIFLSSLYFVGCDVRSEFPNCKI